ncbi:MarR family transcriptional regulator [Amycolatopsis rhabdoformis]|uniref:MarR family transcriptional regulator n=1 Tax=Amycolatopsis rhabdoformis TaxID=1448059 RepID=A0ABZ1I196_9PSEU|nr:MarR family transcriptional regulator [Amycolatopsis rhabdoformis]WSE27424.1 MarR family transcriptional regulator [Amycolatopsis rhabdoformis]
MPSLDDGVRELLMLMPRLTGRGKRAPLPSELADLSLAPRHLCLLSVLVFHGPMTVTELATRLEIAPTTVSLMVGDLSRQGVLTRAEDPADRRRTIVSISDARRAAVDAWLAPGARAWQEALEPLTAEQRALVIETLKAYERGLSGGCC